MKHVSFEEALAAILATDQRYDLQGYLFIREALDFTVKWLKKTEKEGPARHVSGQQLLEGIRKYALQEYGPLAKTTLNRWGIKTSRDVGEIVFSLVHTGVLGKTEEDRIEDFDRWMDFDEAFRAPFRPAAKPQPGKAAVTP